MRTIKELYTLKGKVYLWIGSPGAFHQFAITAKEEGFLLPRGEDDILALNDDWSFCHPGFVGHMAFHNASSASGHKLIRVDYNRWISGEVLCIFCSLVNCLCTNMFHSVILISWNCFLSLTYY